MDRSYEDLSNRDLRGADLSGTTFYRADFRNADLWGCNFSDSDLRDARNLSQAQLAGTDLANAKLPETMAVFDPLESVKSLSESSSKLFTTLLIALIFTILTSANVRDSRVLTNTGNIKVPIIDIEVPVISFYFVTPLILCMMFIYFQISLQRLWEAMATLPAIFPNGRRLDEKTPAWLMNDIPRQHIPRLRATAPEASRVQWLLCFFLAYCVTPLTIFFLWTRSLRFESWFLMGAYSVLFGASVATAAGFSALMDKTLAGRDPEPRGLVHRGIRIAGRGKGIITGATAVACLAIVSFVGTQYDATNPSAMIKILHSLGIQTEPNVDNEEISTKPSTWTGLSNNVSAELALTRGARFTDMQMCRLHAQNAFFVKSVFYRSDISDSWFYNTDLRLCTLDQVMGSNAKWNKCLFSDATDDNAYIPSDSDSQKYHGVAMQGCTLPFFEAKVSELCALRANLCDLHGADFTMAHLTGGAFTNCVLTGALFERARMRRSQFNSIIAKSSGKNRTSFYLADCSHASFSNSDLSGANFTAATLDDAVFDGVDLSDAEFSRASLAGANLANAQGLTAEQLRKANSLHGAMVPANLREELAPMLSGMNP